MRKALSLYRVPGRVVVNPAAILWTISQELIVDKIWREIWFEVDSDVSSSVTMPILNSIVGQVTWQAQCQGGHRFKRRLELIHG